MPETLFEDFPILADGLVIRFTGYSLKKVDDLLDKVLAERKRIEKKVIISLYYDGFNPEGIINLTGLKLKKIKAVIKAHKKQVKEALSNESLETVEYQIV